MLDIHSNSHQDTALDDPITASFASKWAGLSVRHGTATALPEDIGQFAIPGGLTDQDIADFTSAVCARRAPVFVFEPHEALLRSPLSIVGAARCVQMVAMGRSGRESGAQHLPLGKADGADMLALATLTKPGPFARNTHLLGDFIGIRVQGQLVAMAGQRMAFDGWIEISGVCVHPEFRGRGMAQRLIADMGLKIEECGKRPFLHTYADNIAAIRLYEHLGFEIRREFQITMFGPS
jgi:ribosomal protein S18 acetylase RimI-like enzyme